METEMNDKEKRNSKRKAILSSLAAAMILMVFPVASGVFVAVHKLDPLQGYWIQAMFMLLSIIPPALFLVYAKIKPDQIGFVRMANGSIKTVLYFIPVIAAKIGFLGWGINTDLQAIIALACFTMVIGLSEEIYFRGMILRRLMTCFTIKQSVLLSALFFAVIHASQAFSGATGSIIALTILNALIFGIIAAEIAVLTGSIIPVIVWHALYDFINWIALVNGLAEVMIIMLQSAIMILYGRYLWTKLSDHVQQLVS